MGSNFIIVSKSSKEYCWLGKHEIHQNPEFHALLTKFCLEHQGEDLICGWGQSFCDFAEHNLDFDWSFDYKLYQAEWTEVPYSREQ